MTIANGFNKRGRYYERDISKGLKLSFSKYNGCWQIFVLERTVSVDEKHLPPDENLEHVMQCAMKMGSSYISKLASSLWESYHELSKSILCERCGNEYEATDEGRGVYECTNCSGRYSYPELEF